MKIKITQEIVFYSSMLLISFILCEILFHSYRYVKTFMSSDEKEVTFYVLGGSTSYGEPYSNNPSFTLLISDYLGGRYNNRNINIEMIAGPGKTLSSNLYDFKKSIILNPKKHAIVLAYTGINESISRSYNIENDLDFEYVLKKTIVGTIVFRMLDILGISWGGGNSLLKYRKRLQDIAYWSKYAGYQVYLSELVGNFHDYPPESHPEISPTALKNIVDCERVESSFDRLACRKAIANRIDFTPYAFMIARNEYKSNPNIDTFNKLDQFYKHDYSNRPIPEKNVIIRQIASNHDNVTLISTLNAFRKVSDGYMGYNLFEDAHHPNIMGMRIIANQFLRSITFNDDMEVHLLSHIEKKYNLRERFEEIIWSKIIWYFSEIAGGTSYNIENFHYLWDLIDIYHKSHAARAVAMRFLSHPLLPIYSETNIWHEFAKDNKIALIIKEFLPQNRINRMFLANYIDRLNRAKKAGLMSEKSYQKYLSVMGVMGQHDR